MAPPQPVESSERWRCFCKKITKKQRSTKANENFNRQFHTCAQKKCRFFRWEAHSSTSLGITLPTVPTSTTDSPEKGKLLVLENLR